MNFKQEYINQRNADNFSIQWLYKYFLENGGSRINVNDFTNIFRMNININDMTEYLDRKFNLSILYDKEDNFIKVIT